jgi:GR25 family glycosyltransferase involved in LPS biosynthesis
VILNDETGRHDHMQLSTPAMLGCLLSHIQIWQSIQPNEVVAVFEEDAYLDEVSGKRMLALSKDMHSISWDILLLESGQGLISTGQWQHIGEYAATCNSQQLSGFYHPMNKTVPCTWFGTRGYLVTYEGAQRLLQHAYPISVQVDALMGLVAAFSLDFRMYWTRENIAHLQLFHITSVWDGCIKCYLPTSPVHYIIALIVALGFLWHYLRLSAGLPVKS